MIAAKFGDPVAGIDVHMVMVPSPAGPVPTPLPHPFVGVVFDPIGAAVGAAMGAVFGGGGPVVVNGMPIGNTGTEVQNIPHIPTPPGVAPAPNEKPGNEGTLVTGSKTVHFGGSSESRTLSMVMSCGFPVNLPTSVCGAVPMGAPVLIGGPEALDVGAAVTQGVRTKWVSDKLNVLVKGTKGSKRSKFICFLTGHPVDVVTGELIADAIDAELPGLIPLVFERNYRSRETETQLLGAGWYHFFDAYVETLPHATLLRLADGRSAEHEVDWRRTSAYFHAPDRYTLSRETDGFRLRQDGLTYLFRTTDRTGRYRLVSIHDDARNEILLTWSGRYLVAIQDTAGRRIEARYDREGLLERLVLVTTDPREEHLLCRYTYVDGQLASATDPLGHAMRYRYRGGVLVEETHKSGLTFHFEWSWEHPEGWCTRTWGDAGEGDPAVMDLAPGAVGTAGVRAIYDRRITYDAARRRTMVKDLRGGVTLYEGNALDLVTKQIDATGRTTLFEWNDQAWKTAEVDPTGARTEWTYDARGNRLTEKDALGRTTRWTYDALDRVVSVTLPSRATYAVEYDRSSQPAVLQRPDGTAELRRYDDHGRLLHAEDAMGRATRVTWAPDHTPIEVRDSEGRATTFEHDRYGRLVRHVDPLGRVTRLERDLLGRPTRVERADGEVLTQTFDAEGNVLTQTDSRGRTTRMRYAGMGQLVEHTDALGHRVRLHYDTELDLVAVENQLGERYTFELDLLGRVKRERTFSGTKRQFVLDEAGRVTRVVSGAYRVAKLERDRVGRITAQLIQGGDPTTATPPVEERFYYDDEDALIVAKTQAATLALERDVLGRVLAEHSTLLGPASDSPRGSEERTVSSRYDASGLRVERTTSYAHKTEYAYDRAGDLTALAADWHLPDAVGALRSLPQRTAGPFQVRFARDKAGQEIARRLPGGVTAVWSRDPFGRPTEQRILTGASTQSPGRAVSSRKYAWAAPEEIASITHLDSRGTPSSTSQYAYDPRGHLVQQLLSSSQGPSESLGRFADPAGNLFRSADLGDRTYKRGGAIQRADGTRYETDPDGFLTKKVLSDGATTRYTWDPHGQLIAVHRPDGKTVEFTYDCLGRRLTKTFDGKTTEYTWDGDDLVHERVRDDATGALTAPLTTWVFEPDTFSPVAKIEGRKRYGIVGDHLGSPTTLTTEAGKIAWQAQLDLYGVPREETPVGPDAAAEGERTTNPWRFPGQYEDPETGLYYNRFRYYDPQIGRYISEDPIGLLGGVAQFGYVHDPLGWADMQGLSPWAWDSKGGMGHHLVPRQKASSVGWDHLASERHAPTFFPEPYEPGMHEELHRAQRPHIGPSQGPWKGTPAELLKASRAGLNDVSHLRGNLKIPATGEILARNVTPAKAFDVLMKWHKKQLRKKSAKPCGK
jgi:RHS repeat-associated protein